ncbi:MAG: hypothetical protein NC307_11705 [Roseburia sp.]|nr:hypothetical protein [Roseburia sp.]
MDKVTKRDVMTLFHVRSPLLMEKLFLYLCLNSTEIFNAATASKELDTDAIVELCQDEKSKATNAFLITKQLDDFGVTGHETAVPTLRVPAMVFL